MEERQELSEVQRMIVEVCDEVKELLIRKNRAYGNSAIEPMRVFSKASAIEQINVRIDDKLSRIAKGDVSFEDEDVEKDVMGYLVLKRVAKRVQALSANK